MKLMTKAHMNSLAYRAKIVWGVDIVTKRVYAPTQAFPYHHQQQNTVEPNSHT